MTVNAFGGFWTRDKLTVLRDYLGFYRTALSKQRFKLTYIDAFAGTGRCKIKDGRDDVVIDGSAKIALDCGGFDSYCFIERKRRHQTELQQLLDSHPNGARGWIAGRSAEDLLPTLLLGHDWSRTRGVLFLDPFGLQCTHNMLRQIAETKALDVFFLVSLSGLYRQAAISAAAVDEGKASRLTNFLGTDDWRSMYKEHPQQEFWGVPPASREPGWEELLKFTTKQLRKLFPYVGEPNLMGNANGAPLFALYFAVANPSGPAIGLAKRVSTDILAKLPR